MITDTETKAKSAPEISIGERLASARKSEGISLSKASSATKLKITYLEAIEKNNFDALPAPIYAKNFIRIYGNFLGLDGTELSKDFGKKSEAPVIIPEKPKTSFTYYISLCFNAVAKNLFLSAAVVACIILFFVVFNSPEKSEKIAHESVNKTVVVKNIPENDFIVELENYTPVYDPYEPLPKLD